MPKRLLLALVVLALAIPACKGSSSPSTSATATPSPTPNPAASTATVQAEYDGNPYNGTIYANAAASGCPGSTTISGSTISATTGANSQPAGQATLSNLTPDIDYTFFYVVASGPTVSYCGLNWTYGTVDLTYP